MYFQNAIGASARISQPMIAAVHGFVLKLTLDALAGSGHTGTDHRKRVTARRCCIDSRFQCARLVAEEALRLLHLCRASYLVWGWRSCALLLSLRRCLRG